MRCTSAESSRLPRLPAMLAATSSGEAARPAWTHAACADVECGGTDGGCAEHHARASTCDVEMVDADEATTNVFIADAMNHVRRDGRDSPRTTWSQDREESQATAGAEENYTVEPARRPRHHQGDVGARRRHREQGAFSAEPSGSS